MHINIYNSIKNSYLDSDSTNTIHNAKKETKDKNHIIVTPRANHTEIREIQRLYKYETVQLKMT